MLLPLLLLGLSATAHAGWTELDDDGDCHIRLPDNHRFEKVHRPFRRGEPPDQAEASARQVALARMVERVCTDRTAEECAGLRSAIGIDAVVNLRARQVCAVALVRTDLTPARPETSPKPTEVPAPLPRPASTVKTPPPSTGPPSGLTASVSEQAARSRPNEQMSQLHDRLSEAPGDRCALRSGYPTRPIAPGATRVGCTPGVTDDCSLEQRSGSRELEITTPLLVGEIEVTRGLWARIMRQTPPGTDRCGETCPVSNVTWVEAVRFANALSEHDDLRPCYRIRKGTVRWRGGATCEGYRLPTPGEWEHAARAGVDTRFAGSQEVGQVAWWVGNSHDQPHPVALLEPNAFGLYDMSGNVQEWVWGNRRFMTTRDAEGVRPRRVRINDGPTGESFVEDHEIRGGSFRSPRPHVNHIHYAQPTTRMRANGLRLVRYGERCEE